MKSNYYNFKKYKDKYLLTNEEGKYIFLSEEEFHHLVYREYNKLEEGIFVRLKQNYFIYDENDEVFIEKVKEQYRGMKSYLFSATCLHIFVLTNACNLNCVYCQAQDSEQNNKGSMSVETAKRAVDIALQSPEKHLTFEFQGGEPLLCFDVIRFIIEYSQKNCNDKEIEYSLVTNTLLLTDEMIRFFKTHAVKISTSLDGPQWIHDGNRSDKSGRGSFSAVHDNIGRLKQYKVPVGAIQTTTRKSLENPKGIIDAYLEERLPYVFIRPLTPLGYASEHWDEIGYTVDEFISFYREILEYMLRLNQKGVRIIEGHARIFLRKILGGFSENYMELRSPCGAAVGQIAYYYDGNIYTCDEGRMLAEMGSDSFRLGNVYDTLEYDELMNCGVCKGTCQASVLEALPDCCECVYHPYCGVCPVINLALEKNIYSRQANSYRCRIYKGMLDTIFGLIYNNEKALEVFETWI